MEIKGKIVEYETGEPIIGANVYIPISPRDLKVKTINGISLDTISDTNGNFSINIPNNERTIVFDYVDRRPKVMSVKEFSTIPENNIIKLIKAEGIDEIEVIGKRIVKKDNKRIYFILAGLLLLMILIYFYRQKTGDKPIVQLV